MLWESTLSEPEGRSLMVGERGSLPVRSWAGACSDPAEMRFEMVASTRWASCPAGLQCLLGGGRSTGSRGSA